MSRTWTVAVMLSSILACGSPGAKPEGPGRVTANQAVPDAGPQSVPDVPDVADPPAKEAPPPPISIPNGRLYDGYVLGGLPSKEQFTAALDSGFDSAMSLMANDEDGIREIAPYASSIGVRYMRFTVGQTADLTESMAWEFASTLGMLGKPAIIHSANGERVGAMFALMAFFVDDASVEEAMAIGEAAGVGSLADRVRPVLTHE